MGFDLIMCESGHCLLYGLYRLSLACYSGYFRPTRNNINVVIANGNTNNEAMSFEFKLPSIHKIWVSKKGCKLVKVVNIA